MNYYDTPDFDDDEPCLCEGGEVESCDQCISEMKADNERDDR